MKGYFYQTTVFILLVCKIMVTLQACAEGEPMIGEPHPDLNITVLPSTKIPAGTRVAIICYANKPRLLNPGNTNIRPLPAIVIRIFVGDNLVKSCRGNPALKCVHVIRNVNKTIPRRVYCSASNSGGECRFKHLELDITDRNVVSTVWPKTGISTTKNQVDNDIIGIKFAIFGAASVVTVAVVGFAGGISFCR